MTATLDGGGGCTPLSTKVMLGWGENPQLTVPGKAVRMAGHMNSLTSWSDYYALQDLKLEDQEPRKVLL